VALSDPREHSRDNVIAARLAEHERLRRGGADSLEQILLDCVTRSRQPGLDHVFRDGAIDGSSPRPSSSTATTFEWARLN
jgi:hypothetical protein